MNYLVWADIETTGLDPDLDHILEFGLVLTKLQDFAKIHNFTPIAEHRQTLAMPTERMNDFVRAMHTENGLLAELHGKVSPDPDRDYVFAEAQACKFLSDYAPEPNAVFYLAGSSVHFDRSFLRRRMPLFVRKLSHRQVDVSSFKLLFNEQIPCPKVKAAHRAIPDCYESMGELLHYLGRLDVRSNVGATQEIYDGAATTRGGA